MKAPEGPDRVPVDNSQFHTVISAVSFTISRHAPVSRGEGLVGNTCRMPLCNGPVFLTRADASNHQAFEVIRTIRNEADLASLGEDPADDARVLADLMTLLNLGSGTPDAGAAEGAEQAA